MASGLRGVHGGYGGAEVTGREVHHYVRPADRPGVPWPQSDPPCDDVDCQLPRAHAVHDVAEVPEEAREIDARVLGEQLEAAE